MIEKTVEKIILSAISLNAISIVGTQKQAAKLATTQIDKYIFKKLVKKHNESLLEVQRKKYLYVSAMLHSVERNIKKGYVSKNVIKRLTKVLVENLFMHKVENRAYACKEYKEQHGELPPNFIVLSPTQRCNLQCLNCYASSNSNTTPTLPYSIVEKIINDVRKLGIRFITVSGGEPFMYKSEGKTILDIFEKYNDMFFLVYTNGTLITTEIAEKLAKCGNVTPAISVEGYEKETDQRRGKGTYKKVLSAFKNLRKAGVIFGISVTATKKNIDILLSEEFYDFFFETQGASHMWQFQLMPIGRGKSTFDLMVDPINRVKLYRMWERMLKEKKYCLADFWNSGVLTDGCIAYGKDGGYIYIDWNGNIMPCVFIPYYVDNIFNLYKNGKTLLDVLSTDFMKKGREWQNNYGFKNPKKAKNWLMPCSIRDHYEFFRKSILPKDAKGENKEAQEILSDDTYFNTLCNYDKELEGLTNKIWENEYLKIG